MNYQVRKKLLSDHPNLWQRFKCWIRCHGAWQYYRQQTILDIFPPPGMGPLRRRCFWCGCKERWLPGYGGTELGCWLPDWDVPTQGNGEPIPKEE